MQPIFKKVIKLSLDEIMMLFFCHYFQTDGSIQSCSATAYVMSAALSPGALIALLVCMLILIGKRTDVPAVTRRAQINGWMLDG